MPGVGTELPKLFWMTFGFSRRTFADTETAIGREGAMYSIAEYVLDLSALADIVGQFPISFIGHSLGAAIVLQYAGVYPDRRTKSCGD